MTIITAERSLREQFPRLLPHGESVDVREGEPMPFEGNHIPPYLLLFFEEKGL